MLCCRHYCDVDDVTLRSRHYSDVDDVTGDGVDVNGGDVDVHGDDVGVDVDCLNGCVVADDGDQGSIEARDVENDPPKGFRGRTWMS